MQDKKQYGDEKTTLAYFPIAFPHILLWIMQGTAGPITATTSWNAMCLSEREKEVAEGEQELLQCNSAEKLGHCWGFQGHLGSAGNQIPGDKEFLPQMLPQGGHCLFQPCGLQKKF